MYSSQCADYNFVLSSNVSISVLWLIVTNEYLFFFVPDIDECAEPDVRVSPCKNARCVNTSGSYKCLCKQGFVHTRRPNVCIRRRTR